MSDALSVSKAFVLEGAALTTLRVFVTNPTPRPTADPIAASSLEAAWKTYDVAVAALVVGSVTIFIALAALLVAIRDARNNSAQLNLLIAERNRKPVLSLQTSEAKKGEKQELGSQTYAKVTTRFTIVNASTATKAASTIFANVSFPEAILTQTEYRRKGGRLLSDALGPKEQAESNPLNIAVTAAALGVPGRIKHGNLFDSEDIADARVDDGYRSVAYTGGDDPLLAGLAKIVSSEINFWVPTENPVIRWNIKCHESEDWYDGEIRLLDE